MKYEGNNANCNKSMKLPKEKEFLRPFFRSIIAICFDAKHNLGR